eukprot:4379685-Prymnesium_polylepis.1
MQGAEDDTWEQAATHRGTLDPQLIGAWRASLDVAECAWAFVGVADCGRGLFARTSIHATQAICEYCGPRLPLHMLAR